MNVRRTLAALTVGLTMLVSTGSSYALSQSTSVATASSVTQAQRIMSNLNIPAGPADGQFGPQTAQGLCAFRVISGYTAKRTTVNSELLGKLRAYNQRYSSVSQIPAPRLNGHSTYLLVQQHCQVMFYVENGHYVRVIPVSTGRPSYPTPNGAYMLGGTALGWYCSNQFPEGCYKQTAGKFANANPQSHGKGNMYNPRHFSGGKFVHGDTQVPTYPYSHGCVRITPAESDWMYYHVGNSGPTYMVITGAY